MPIVFMFLTFQLFFPSLHMRQQSIDTAIDMAEVLRLHGFPAEMKIYVHRVLVKVHSVLDSSVFLKALLLCGAKTFFLSQSLFGYQEVFYLRSFRNVKDGLSLLCTVASPM